MHHTHSLHDGIWIADKQKQLVKFALRNHIQIVCEFSLHFRLSEVCVPVNPICGIHLKFLELRYVVYFLMYEMSVWHCARQSSFIVTLVSIRCVTWVSQHDGLAWSLRIVRRAFA